MATKISYVFITGKGKYNRLIVPDKFGKFSMKVWLNDTSLEIIKELQKGDGTHDGIQNVLGKDDDGYFMAFSRPTFIAKRDGSRPTIPAPIILDKDGKTPLTNTQVGDGSDVTVKLEVRKYVDPLKNKKTSLRIESVRVNELVPYTSDNFKREELKSIEGLAEQPF
jgi:hypothetical protein